MLYTIYGGIGIMIVMDVSSIMLATELVLIPGEGGATDRVVFTSSIRAVSGYW